MGPRREHLIQKSLWTFAYFSTGLVEKLSDIEFVEVNILVACQQKDL